MGINRQRQVPTSQVSGFTFTPAEATFILKRSKMKIVFIVLLCMVYLHSVVNAGAIHDRCHATCMKEANDENAHAQCIENDCNHHCNCACRITVLGAKLCPKRG